MLPIIAPALSLSLSLFYFASLALNLFLSSLPPTISLSPSSLLYEVFRNKNRL